MSTSAIIRATFGRLSVTKSSLGRITIGHIQIEGTILDQGRRNTGGYAGKNPVRDPDLGVRLILLTDEFKKQRLNEDNELIELVLAMIEGNLI